MDSFTRRIMDRQSNIPARLARPPAADLVFFDDLVQVDESQPTTKLYGSSSPSASITGTPGSPSRINLFLKSKAAFAAPRFIAFPSSVFGGSVLFDRTTIGTETLLGATQAANMYLIRQPLALGETYGLDNLDWDLAQTLLGDAANYEGPFTIGGASGSVDCGSPPMLFINGDPSVGFAGNQGGCPVGRWFWDSDVAAVDGKKFYGVMIYLNLSGESGPDLTATVSAIAGSLTLMDLTDVALYPRPFVARKDLKPIWP
jgi:hypothetical protein